MISVLIYDIPDDKLRAKVADICLDYGLGSRGDALRELQGTSAWYILSGDNI